MLALLFNQIKKYDCFFTFPLIFPFNFFLNEGVNLYISSMTWRIPD